MLNMSYGSGDRTQIIDRLKQHPNTRLLDIGASDDVWTHQTGITPDILDLKPTWTKGKFFRGDINNEYGWAEVLDHVNTVGKYDFAVCAHTLEDIRNPDLALRMLPRIANAGFLSFPSHMRELTRRCEYNSQYRGYFHHRWMFKPHMNYLLVIPKLPFLEYLDIPYEAKLDETELRVYWSGKIDYELFNDDYMGPNPEIMTNKFKEILGAR